MGKNRKVRDYEGGHGIKALGRMDRRARRVEPESITATATELAGLLQNDRRQQAIRYLQNARCVPGMVVTVGRAQVLGECLTFAEAWQALFPDLPMPARSR